MKELAGIKFPDMVTSDPALLSAFFNGYSIADSWRKVLLSAVKEKVRAAAALNGTRMSEARVEDVARISGEYVEFLTNLLHARYKFEKNVKESEAYK